MAKQNVIQFFTVDLEATMSLFKSKLITMFAAAAMLFTLHVGSVLGELAYPVFTDLNASGGPVFGDTDIFDDGVQMDWNEEAVFKGNDILVATLVGGGDFAGIGITVPISNGENGIDQHDCQGDHAQCVDGLNIDIPNTEPVNSAISAANGGGKLSNGNIIRASVWMRSDPNDPATGVGAPGPASMPQVEGIFKIELWKEALSGFADFDGPGDSDYGDRIWDQDQQGGKGSFVDINADGSSGGFGAPVTVTLNTESWTQMVVEYEVDDSPADAGNTLFPWDIGLNSYTVADVEGVRAVFFAGDFTGSTNFAGGGSWWMDNLAVEVFANQAAADLVDPLTTNPAPVESNFDLDGDGDTDGHDFQLAQKFCVEDCTQPVIDNFGNGVGPVGSLSAVPEPSSVAIADHLRIFRRQSKAATVVSRLVEAPRYRRSVAWSPFLP